MPLQTVYTGIVHRFPTFPKDRELNGFGFQFCLEWALSNNGSEGREVQVLLPTEDFCSCFLKITLLAEGFFRFTVQPLVWPSESWAWIAHDWLHLSKKICVCLFCRVSGSSKSAASYSFDELYKEFQLIVQHQSATLRLWFILTALRVVGSAKNL